MNWDFFIGCIVGFTVGGIILGPQLVRYKVLSALYKTLAEHVLETNSDIVKLSKGEMTKEEFEAKTEEMYKKNEGIIN